MVQPGIMGRLNACLLGLALAFWAGFAFSAMAFDIVPDAKLHLRPTQTVKVGAGKGQVQWWSVWDANQQHYGGEAKIVWTYVLNNPIPAKAPAAKAWYKKQIQAVLKGIGGEQPKDISVDMERAGSTVVVEGPEFAADFNLFYKDREQFSGNIYALKILQGKGRLIVFDVAPGEQLSLPEPAADFARLWGGRMRDMSPLDFN